MAPDYDSPPLQLRQLIERFADNLDAYRAGRYNETQVRREFIDPFFTLLGWDVDNRQGYAEQYKDVVHEDAIKVGGVTKAPDYCFRIGSLRKFFVEAKKPSVNVRDDVAAAFQVRRYAWSAKLPLSILTDFEEFAVYDCRKKPEKHDAASTGRIMMFSYRDYEKRWRDIASVFAREAILRGSFDKFAESTRDKRGTAEVDKAFLAEIEEWRDALARNLALRNPALTQRELNFAVQRSIDRIIFLRICEDRGIEPYGQLQGLLNGGQVYPRLCGIFDRADERYNSGLFHFHAEKERAEAPDELSLRLSIDDKVLKEIFTRLYYPDSPYEFSVLPADILGQVYEQFLGKVIRLTAGHQAKVEEKPEVKKAGGVYYTPTYIVDYIVEHTVGKLLEEKTPKQAAALRILDPACGSGSFLIGAYQYLLDWHLQYYLNDDPGKHARSRPSRVVQTTGGWRLTTGERKRILLNNIYGVDIDAQAVEVTRLSLLLKVLEGETKESLTAQITMFRERALPDLGSNIKCGNSLIGPDFYEGRQLTMLDEEEMYRVNAFDWNSETDGFGKIMKAGGFDAVIGNPPYIQQSMAEYFSREVNDYYIKVYSSSMGRMNTFGLFIEKSNKYLLKQHGFLSFIVPNTILTQEYYHHLRRQLLEKIICNITLYTFPVFQNAVVETIVFIINNSLPINNNITVVEYDNRQYSSNIAIVSQDYYQTTKWNAFISKVSDKQLALKAHIDKEGSPLDKIVNINQAIALKQDRKSSLYPQALANNYKRVLDGRNINRYSLQWGGLYLAYDINKIHSCKRIDIFEAPEKIFFRRVGDRLIATYDDEQYYALNTLVVITLRTGCKYSIKYILGLLNSKLINYYYVSFLKSTKKVFSEIQARQLAQLPICLIENSLRSDNLIHNNIVNLVDNMIILNKHLVSAKLDQEKSVIKRQIEAIDRQIDVLVCRRLPSASPLCSPALTIRRDGGVSLRYTERHLD